VRLTINNYDVWCDVTVDDGDPSGGVDPIVVDVAPGTVVDLHADKLNDSFQWGYWYGTEGGTERVTEKSTTVTVNADMTVQACCPIKSDNPVDCDAPVPVP
jgi:hypothetical protein